MTGHRVCFAARVLESGPAVFGQIAPKAVDRNIAREWRLLTKRTLAPPSPLDTARPLSTREAVEPGRGLAYVIEG